MNLLFATQNPNKVKEIQNRLGNSSQVKSLLDIGYTEELEETQPTLEGNALQKASFVYQKFEEACFADDTGLEIVELNGEPGVYSARYGGAEKSFEKNIALVLKKMEGVKNRSAQFRTVIVFIDKQGNKQVFEGVCRGKILTERKGTKGFGYDSIFQPEGYEETFAQMDLTLKNKISHRGIAVNKLAQFLKH